MVMMMMTMMTTMLTVMVMVTVVVMMMISNQGPTIRAVGVSLSRGVLAVQEARVGVQHALLRVQDALVPVHVVVVGLGVQNPVGPRLVTVHVRLGVQDVVLSRDTPVGPGLGLGEGRVVFAWTLARQLAPGSCF